jgi:hypothetical protein
MDIGKLREVELREVWPNEAQSFTPWLEAHPEELGEVLGIDNLSLQREKSVGAFSLDLFGTDLDSGQNIVVENQLEKSDHSHLGQLLTYAGGLESGLVVWIAKEIRQEHRAALEWLNSVTNNDTKFFGIEIKAVRIGDSAAAPWLDLVVQPNAWSKGLKESSAGMYDSERSKAYAEFWQKLIDELSEQYPEFNGRTAWGRTWFPTTIGTSGVSINLVFSSKGLRVEYYLGSSDGEINLARFEALLSLRTEIEGLVGEELEWESLEGKKACRISLYGQLDGDVENRENWSTYSSWFARSFVKMKNAIDEEFRAAISVAK